MIATKKTRKKARQINWRARAKKALRVAAAAAEFEYRYFLNYQTYTSREAAEIADKRKDTAFEDLRWALRDTKMLKRD